MISQPTRVIILGATGGSPPAAPISTDSNGVVNVSPPTQKQAGVEVIAKLDTIGNLSFPGNNTVYGVGSLAFGYANDNTTGDWFQLLSGGTDIDNDAVLTNQVLFVKSFNAGYDGTAWDRIRVASVFKNIVATAAGNTAVWTPAAGTKFRLMGYTISVAGILAATAVQTIQLRDGATTVIDRRAATVTATTPTGDSQLAADFGQGQLSALANNVLNINLGSAMTGGGVYVNAWGTEE
jgi:hypothetical protein